MIFRTKVRHKLKKTPKGWKVHVAVYRRKFHSSDALGYYPNVYDYTHDETILKKTFKKKKKAEKAYHSALATAEQRRQEIKRGSHRGMPTWRSPKL